MAFNPLVLQEQPMPVRHIDPQRCVCCALRSAASRKAEAAADALILQGVAHEKAHELAAAVECWEVRGSSSRQNSPL
jgi:hypothetical protein